MAHDYIKQDLQVDQATGKVGFQIMGTLLGGVLLICAVIARIFYPNQDASDLLAAASAVLLGAPLVWVALKDLYQGHYHMNELVALAVLAAFATGEYLEAGAIAFFMIISVLIENRTALGAQASIESLIRITPTKAHRLTGDGEEEVEARQLHAGDVVRVRPGDNIPADGRIVRGESTVNEANITGESLPADKNQGDEVFGGTINLTGVLEVEVTKAGEDTTLGRVKDLILQAERTRIPMLRMIDRYAAWYTPTVLMLVFIVWFFTSQASPDDAAQRAIAMLVIACPCPLILATPTAMVAALSAAARLGVLVKSVVDLEAARNLTAMVFDKTGTLTTGQLEVARLSPAEGVKGADLLQAAAAAEQHSRHPVARAVTKVARKARVSFAEPEQFQEVAGKGVIARIGDEQILVGRGNWVAEQRTGMAEQIDAWQQADEATGLSTLFVVRGEKLLGWIGLADNTRAEAAASMDELRGMGLKRLIIVTGDRESVAKRVAGQMHAEYKAEVLPHQKLEMVDELKSRGHRVAVIGDGVNDAPALAAGDISIAMGAAGSDVAIHSANIALMNNNLNRIPFLVRLSQVTSRVVKQNMIIGIGFIGVFLGFSAAGFVNPIVAAVIHVVSSLLVVFNSARLVREGEEIEHAEHEAAAAAAGRAPARRSESAPASPGAPQTAAATPA
ncbi:MAG: heavy metal translocating P-type ATPase [Phycisphaeraceae bacterium]